MKNKALSILLSFVVAFGLWLYVVMVVNPEWEQTYTDIPVVFQNENLLAERGLMIVSDDKPTVQLRLSGNRADLMELSSANISVVCNVASIESSGEFTLNYSVYYANNAISVVGKMPESINLKVEKKVTKPVDVVVVPNGETPSGYIDDRDNLTLDYTSIEVTGPQSVIERIHEAQVYVDLEGKTQPIIGQFPYTLVDADGEPVDADQVEVNTDQVSLVLKILRLKDLLIKVEVIYGGGASASTTEVKLNLEQIKVSGNESDLAGLEVLEVGTVDLSKLLEDQQLTFDIKLPAGVNNVTGVDKVTVDIKFLSLAMKTLQITNIRPINVPADMYAEINNKVMPITFRGPADMIESLTAEDVVVEVDIANMQAGTTSVKPNIIIDKYPGVGAVTYDNVVVELQQNSDTVEE